MNKQLKTTTICFRTTPELREELKALAESEYRSMSQLIELILIDGLGKRQCFENKKV